jgi:hypothetical protein
MRFCAEHISGDKKKIRKVCQICLNPFSAKETQLFSRCTPFNPCSEEAHRPYLPRLGEDTQNELAFVPPSLGETTLERTRESLDCTQASGQ